MFLTHLKFAFLLLSNLQNFKKQTTVVQLKSLNKESFTKICFNTCSKNLFFRKVKSCLKDPSQ